MRTKEDLEESRKLDDCPFCKGVAHFEHNQAGNIMLCHYPESGVVCPARYEQYCETYDMGLIWWNERAL